MGNSTITNNASPSKYQDVLASLWYLGFRIFFLFMSYSFSLDG